MAKKEANSFVLTIAGIAAATVIGVVGVKLTPAPHVIFSLAPSAEPQATAEPDPISCVLAGTGQVVDFADYEQLEKTANGAFRSNAQPQGVNGTVIKQGYLEDSNVSMVQEMTNMMSGQRSLQSSAQLLKMYDQLSGKAIQLGSM